MDKVVREMKWSMLSTAAIAGVISCEGWRVKARASNEGRCARWRRMVRGKMH